MLCCALTSTSLFPLCTFTGLHFLSNLTFGGFKSYWYDVPIHKHRHHKTQHSHRHHHQHNAENTQHSSFTDESHHQPSIPQHTIHSHDSDHSNREPSPQHFDPSYSQVDKAEDHQTHVFQDISSIENAEQEWQETPILNLPAHEIEILSSSINEAADLDELLEPVKSAADLDELLEPVKSAASSIGEDCCCDDYVSDEEDGKEDQWQQALGEWEAGRPDYAGRDSFDNILSHIQRSMGQ